METFYGLHVRSIRVLEELVIFLDLFIDKPFYLWSFLHFIEFSNPFSSQSSGSVFYE